MYQVKVNKILKEKWIAFSEEERQVWKKWQEWDAKRYERDIKIYEKKMRRSDEKLVGTSRVKQEESVEDNRQKVKREESAEDDDKGAKGPFHIPKKKRTID